MFKEILCGDSLYILKNYIPSNVIDIIITSPPYNVAHNYENYNDNLDFKEYLQTLSAIFKECYRTLKSGGRICVNVPFAVKNKESKEVRFLSVYITQILNEVGFREFELITWHKGKDIRHFQGNNTAWGSWKSPSCPSFRPLGEAVLVFYKDTRTHKGEAQNIDISSEEFKEWTKNIWYFDKNSQQSFENVLCVSNNAKKEGHPAPYPTELIERLLKMYSYKFDIVLDPFGGTGTTAVVASRLQRQFFSLELSKKYCQITQNRLLQQGETLNIKSFSNNLSTLVNSKDSKNTLNEIFPYKEAFSPNILHFLASNYACNIQSVFDPFCGTGSSFLDTRTKNCYGFDTSPFAIEITQAKLQPLNPKEIPKIQKTLQNFSPKDIQHHPLPSWQSFSKYVTQERFNTTISFIQAFSKLDTRSYHFLKYIILSHLSDIFNYKRDGNGIKFRPSKVKDCLEYLKDLIKKALLLKENFDTHNQKTLYLKNASSVKNSINTQVDCILTSPPYANLFDYFEVYKIELWTSGILQDTKAWQNLKKSALRNNKNANLQTKDCIKNETLEKSLETLRDKNIETSTLKMLNNYFYDMREVIKNCFKSLKNGGFFFLVVGNSSYKATPIKTDEILAQEAQKIGFECVEILVARVLNTSPQQMKALNPSDKFYLRESIIVLHKR